MNLREMFDLLLARFGPQGWWPGETPEERLAGCVLAQNARWDRVEKAIERLRRSGMLFHFSISETSVEELGGMIRESGTYRRKAEYLREVWRFMESRGWDGTPGSVVQETGDLRKELLSVRGVGPETADCILLYVLKRPVFVVDAYTRRILSRHGICGEKASYREIQTLFHSSLEPDEEVFNEFHALLVACAKRYCRPRPECGGCPLGSGFA